jgi:heat shock protein beta
MRIQRHALLVAIIIGSLATFSQVAQAITEDMDEITLRDAGATKQRPYNPEYDLDENQQAEVEANKESFSFNADVSRLMDIIINSLYTKKEVFIRELVSNASDALDKVRFISVQDPDYLGNTPELEIKIDFDYDAKTVSITDTGVGMTKAELVKNLGTVAKSGTTAFLEAMGQGENMSLIGQFGVGFYSAFLVANKVVVTSKSNDDEQHIWTSTADSKFFLTKDPRGDTLGRGTRVTLHLKDDAVEFVEQDKIKNLVKKYSEFINYPISLYLSKDVKEQVPIDTPDPRAVKVTRFDEDGNEVIEDDVVEEEEVADGDEGDMEITDEGEDDPEEEAEVKTKTITTQVWEWQLINEIKAIWTRNKDEITEEEYNNFYKTISKDPEDPLTYTHFRAEGEIDFKSILYIPASAPFDLFENYYGRSAALKLYVRRVLITEEFEDLMPKYLNFVKGVVDSDDLPLNVSREQLQQLKMIKVMSKKLVRKAIEMVRKLAEEEEDEYEDDEDDYDEYEEEEDEEEEGVDDEEGDEEADEEEEDEDHVDKYEIFWKNFGKNIKLGVIEDSSNRLKLAKLLRFFSTEDPEALTSLDEYISRMKEDQDTILYLSGDTKESILKSPILAKYVAQGYEVLLLDDPIDEFTTQHLSEYEKRKVKSISKDDVQILDSDEIAKKKLQKLKEMYKPLTDWYKTHLGRQVEKVSISNKLLDAPLFIFTSQYGYSAQLEKINKAQAFANQEKAPSYMLAKKTLELNPHHSVMKLLLEELKENDGTLGEAATEYANLLFQMALLNSGFLIESPDELTEPLEKLIKVGFGLARDEAVTEIEIELEDEEDEEEEEEEEAEMEVFDLDDLETEIVMEDLEPAADAEEM